MNGEVLIVRMVRDTKAGKNIEQVVASNFFGRRMKHEKALLEV